MSTQSVPTGIISCMKLSLITSKKEWETLRPEWDPLVAKSFRVYPFLEFWYLFNWWQTLGGGEWPEENSRLQIVTARENGDLIGIAPLFTSYKAGSEPAIRFIGQIEVTDHLDFICLPDKLESFLSQLLDFINENPEFNTKRLELANILKDSPTNSMMESLCREKQGSFELTVLQPSPGIPLPSSWDGYLQSLSKKQRHEVRRKERNAERDHQVELVFSQDSTDIDGEMGRFIELMRNEEQKAKFLTPLTEQFLLELGRAAQEAGCLNLANLMLDGKQAAVYLNFIFDNKLWVYNTGWNPEFSQASPGWVLLVKLIQWAIANGLNEVDMMRGDEEYKYRFGGIDRHVVQIIADLI